MLRTPTLSNTTWKILPTKSCCTYFFFLPLESPKLVEPQLILLPNIIPVRRALLDFYLILVYSPILPQTLPCVLAYLRLFTGQKFWISIHMFQRPFASGFSEWHAKCPLWGTGKRAQQNLLLEGTSVVHGEPEASILGTVAELELATISRLSVQLATTSTVQRRKIAAGLESS